MSVLWSVITIDRGEEEGENGDLRRLERMKHVRFLLFVPCPMWRSGGLGWHCQTQG